jgi:hypothetical protein
MDRIHGKYKTMSNYVEAPEKTLPVDPQPAERRTGGQIPGAKQKHPSSSLCLCHPPTHQEKKTHSPLKSHVCCCSSLSCFRFTANWPVLSTYISTLADAQRLIGHAQGLPRSAIARNMNTKVSGTSSNLFISIPPVFTRFHRARHRH